ncbi:MAG: glycosyltransferase family 4 protein [Microcoleaceae cyanobacterium]
MTGKLLINLSVLIPQATGISVYINGVLPQLNSLNPTLLAAESVFLDATSHHYTIPGNMTPDQGTTGHLRRLLWTQLKLPRLYHRLQGNLLFSPLPEAPLYAGCRSIVMAHDVIPLRFPRRGSRLTAYFKHYVPVVLHQAEHILCNSVSTAKDLTQFFNVAPAKVTPIPLAYNSYQFKFLNLPTRNYFLYIGRHDVYKNLHRLISAFGQFVKRDNPRRHHFKNSDYELWLVGPTDQTYTPDLKAQAEELSIGSNIRFLDYVPASELTRMINQAIALVFPTLWEGFGLPVLEAMACGTPVITSRLASLPEVGGEAALYVDPYRIETITDAMVQLAEDEGLRLRLRQLGLQQARQFTWEKTGQKTAEVLSNHLV